MSRLTPNQVVAHNLRRARLLHGWTQDRAAEELEPFLGERWSRIVFSSAERSITGDRIRQFTADQIVAFAAAFRLPVPFFLEPPMDLGDLELIAPTDAIKGLTPEQMQQLTKSAVDDYVSAAVLERLREIGVREAGQLPTIRGHESEGDES